MHLPIQQTLILLRLFRIWQKNHPKLSLLFSLGPWCSDLWQQFRHRCCMPEPDAASQEQGARGRAPGPPHHPFHCLGSLSLTKRFL